MSNMYTCEQVAQRYGVKTLTVWGWIRKKKLPAIKLGRDYRIRQEDLDAFEQAQYQSILSKDSLLMLSFLCCVYIVA